MKTKNNLEESLLATLKKSGKAFIMDDSDVATEEYAHFFFAGGYEGRVRLFDCTLYTLRLFHEGELLDVVQQKALEQFPEYKSLEQLEEITGTDEDNKVSLFMAEMIVELEEEEAVKVQEHVDLITDHEPGISVNVGLHTEEITTGLIEQFIIDFNANKLQLDDTFYSFTLARE